MIFDKLVVFGIIGIVIGLISFYSNIFKANKRVFIALIVLGAFIGLASWPGTYFMGYTLKMPEGVWRVVGIPFYVAFFDSQGADYLTPYMLYSVIGNAVFWFLVPQIILASIQRYSKNKK